MGPEGRPQLLRIGLLVESVKTSKYIYNFVKWAQTQASVLEITHIVVLDQQVSVTERRHCNKRYSLISGGLSKVLHQLILKIEKRSLTRETKRYSDHLDTFDLSELVPEQIIISSIMSTSVGLCEEDAACKLKNLNLDLLIRCGPVILQKNILSTARLGVISLCYSDNRTFRGGPAGFWEVYFRKDTTGFTIQCLTDESDDGSALMRGHVQTSYYYLLNQAVLLDTANHYLKSLVKKIAETRRLPDILPGVPYSNRLFGLPTAYQASNYLLRLYALRVLKKVRQIAGIGYRWHVGYTSGGWRNAVLAGSTTVNNPPSHFLADPFVFTRNNKNFCFVEVFGSPSFKGKIDVYELTKDDGAIRIGTALEEPFHLSFPFIFEYREDLYMCPESSASRDIRIYKCTEFPLIWKLEKVIMQNVSAADTMLFEKDGKWWLLTNIDALGVGNHLSELSIFYSDSPFGERWTPHALNPIIVDAGCARNAGLVKDGNTYFRISQSQGFDTYGKRILINEMVELTISSYLEKPISTITSSFADDAVCTHHLHSNGLITVFDFATINRTKPWLKILNDAGRSFGAKALGMLDSRAR
jgi:hypothetical protein